MKPTKVSSLIAIVIPIAIATAILVYRFYGDLPPVKFGLPLTLGALAWFEFVLGSWVKERIDEGQVGQDRSQLHPLTAARILVLGMASAWFGAIITGFYLGYGWFVLREMHLLVAAQDDAPGVLSGVVAGVVLTAAGLRLEKSCGSPPPTEEQDETGKVVLNS